MSKIKEAIQRFLSIALSVTTTVWLSGITLLLPVSPALAVAPGDYGLTEGNLVRAPSLAAPEGWKVYIINQAGYKRHIFNPDVFNMYGHLKWTDIKDLSAATVQAFTTSDLYRIAGDGKVWSVGDDGVKHWINMTAEEFTVKGYNWSQIFDVNATEGNYYTQGSDITSGATPPPVPVGAVSVSLSPSTPATAVLAAGTVFNTITTLRVTAGAQDASISGLTVTKEGLLANTLISGISVWKGNMRQGNILTSLTSEGKATFSFGTPISIPANSTVDLDLKANISSSAVSGTFDFAVLSSADVSASGTVSGTFPVRGNGFSVISSGALGSYTITAQAVGGASSDFPASGSGNLEIGVSQKEVGKFQFNETTGREDMLVKQVTIYIQGSIQAKDAANWKLYAPDGAVLSTGTINQPYITFNLDTAYRIPNGTTRTLSVKVDPVDGADRTLRTHIQNDYDLLVQGAQTGAYVAPASFTDQAPSDGYWRLKQGSLTASLTPGSPSGNIAVGAQEAVLAKYDLRAVGEQLEIRKMDLEIVESSSSTAQQLTGNVKVQSDDGATTYLSLAATDSNLQTISDTLNATRYDLNSYIIIPSGTTKTIKVIGTLKTTATSVQTYKASVGNFYAYRTSTKDFADLLTSTAGVDGNTLTVQTSALTVGKNNSVADKNVALGANGVVLGSFVMQAGAAEGVNVSAITITYAGTGSVTSDVTNLSLWANGTQFGTTVGTPSSGSDSFNGTLPIATSQTVTIEVKGNVKTSATAGQTAIMKISNVSATGQVTSNTITATATDGTTAVSASAPITGQTITYRAGSLTISKEGALTTKIVTAGSTGVALDRVKFQALNDTLTLQKVRFNTTTDGSTLGGSIYIKKAYLYDGATNLTPNGIIPQTVSSSAEILFDGLSVSLVPGAAKFLTLQADLSDATVITAAGDVGTFAVGIKSDASTDNLQVVGTQGNLAAASINTSGTDSNIAASDVFLFHRTSPVVDGKPSGAPSGTLSPQSAQEVFRFNVKSTTAGTSMRLGRIKMSVNIAPVNGWTGTIGTWDLWEGTTTPSVRIAQNVSLLLASGTTSGTLTFDNTNDVSSLFDESASAAEITAGTNGRLVDDSGKTYFLKVDTSNIRATSSGTPGNATLSFKIDGITGSTTATGTSTDPYDGTAVAASSENNWGGGGIFYAYQLTSDLSYIGGTNTTTGFNALDSYPANSNTLTY